MNRYLSLSALFFLCIAGVSCGARHSLSPADFLPKDKDFEFEVPKGWSTNLMNRSRLVATTAGSDAEAISKIVDNNPASTWTGKNYGEKPSFTFDLDSAAVFNRLVFFTRHTDARGTGGGCNAAKHVLVSASSAEDADSFFTVAEGILPCPRGQCIPTDGGRVCFFIDNTDPTIVSVPAVHARFIRIQILSAHWLPIAEKEWLPELSYALSEVMIFLAPDSSVGH